MASKALLATQNATQHVDVLRQADSVSMKRLGLSLLLRDIETYASDLRPSSWRSLRMEFYRLAGSYALTPVGFFDFATYLPHIFGLMLLCGDFESATDFLCRFSQIADLLRTTSTLGREEEQDKVKLCLKHSAAAFLQTALQAASWPGRTLNPRFMAALRKLRLLDPGISLPSSAEHLKRLAKKLLLADWGSLPYKEYWYRSQSTDELGPAVPRQIEIRRTLRLGAVRRFRKLAHRLKIPYWPALAFPTRPFRVDEIPLAAPEVFHDAMAYQRAIVALQEVQAPKASSIAIVLEPPSPKAFTTFVVPGSPREKITVGLSSYKTTEDHWIAAAMGKQDRSLRRYRDLNELINRMLTERVRPDYIVFPELSIPLPWALRIANKLASNNVSLLAGVEYHRNPKSSALRNDCLVSLVTNRPGHADHIIRLQPKFEPAHHESEHLRRLNPKNKREIYLPTGKLALPTLYQHKEFCFAVLICSDLTNIANRSTLRGELDTLFVLEWNSDVKTFCSLVEATAMDLHTYVVQANNRLYGESRIEVPAKESYRRDMVQVKGGVSDDYVIGQIDYQELRRDQMRKIAKVFKRTPIGFTMSDRRRMT
ncbi:MAG: hypothetical protein ACP5E5_14670 [Acidobacteriaceae bacterium]